MFTAAAGLISAITGLVVAVQQVWPHHAAARSSPPVVSAIDSATYSRWADQLIALHFDYLAWARGIEFTLPPLAYAAYPQRNIARSLISPKSRRENRPGSAPNPGRRPPR